MKIGEYVEEKKKEMERDPRRSPSDKGKPTFVVDCIPLSAKISHETCLQNQRSGRYGACLSCKEWEEPRVESSATGIDAPRCKQHPDRLAVIGKGGRNTGSCKECLLDRAAKIRDPDRRRTYKRGRKRIKKVDLVDDRDERVTIDFSPYPEILKKVSESANRNFRTMEAEILFVLNGLPNESKSTEERRPGDGAQSPG